MKVHCPSIYTNCLKVISTFFHAQRRSSLDDKLYGHHYTPRIASEIKVAGQDSGIMKSF